jgi:hypothetical protein
MKSYSLFLSVTGAVVAGFLMFGGSARAQSAHEEQAKAILQLFESGQKDSAYALLEPLKKSARFEPAVLYTRAQMTPDDRALSLYKEVIAIEPNGTWADRAAYQLVARYAEKRDSVAAYTWAGVLKTNYSRSQFVANADELLKNPGSWRPSEDDLADLTSAKGKTGAKKPDTDPAKPKTDAKKPDAKSPTAPGSDPKKPEKADPAAKKPDSPKLADAGKKPPVTAPAKSTPAAAESYSSSGMKGYALQVGLFPTRDMADDRAAELKKKNIRSVALPKMIGGKKQYALVIGPYTTIEDANKKKSVVAGACACQAFVVKVD